MKTAFKTFLKSPLCVTLVWLLGVVIIWEIGAAYIASVKRTPENVLPHIHKIIESVFSKKQVSQGQTAFQIVASNAGATLTRAGIGFIIGAALGFLLALAMRLSSVVEKTAFPYLMLIQMIPILGMAPIVLAVTKDIGVSRIIIAAILTFYPVSTSTLAGFKAVDKEKYDLMRICAANKFQLYVKTLIPSCVPYFFTGLKISAPMAITASILVDTLQGDGGLGCMLSQSLKLAMSIYVFWQIVIFSAVIGIMSSWLIGIIENFLSPHKRSIKV
jgi:NitT/TauT family transport system permease protein